MSVPAPPPAPARTPPCAAEQAPSAIEEGSIKTATPPNSTVRHVGLSILLLLYLVFAFLAYLAVKDGLYLAFVACVLMGFTLWMLASSVRGGDWMV